VVFWVNSFFHDYFSFRLDFGNQSKLPNDNNNIFIFLQTNI